MKIENDKLRPLLTVKAGQLEEVWCSYEGAAPVWMFKFLNAHTRGWVRAIGLDILACYQEYFKRNKIETQYEDSLHVIPQKGETFARAQRKDIQASIRNFFRDYLRTKNKEAARTESYDPNLHDTSVCDKAFDEQDKDSSTVFARTWAMLSKDDQKILRAYQENKCNEMTAADSEGIKLPRTTFQRRLEKARWAFLANLGLEKVRQLVHNETVLKLLDALIASKGDIASAAKILGITRNECRNAFKEILLPALLKACGGKEKLMELCI